MPLITLPVRPWLPDLASLGTGASMVVKNVLPRTATSYGPLSSLSPVATASLPARCQGAYAAADANGNVTIFAGTATDLYTLQSSGSAFVNASGSGYTLGEDQFWRFAVTTSRLHATNLNDPIQTFVLGSSTNFSDLSATAPKAKYCAGIKQWLMVAFTDDPVGGIAPWRIWWSAVNDPTSWPTPGTDAAAAVQSDYNDLSGESGAITGIVGNLGTSEGAVFFEHAVWRIVYVGPPQVFDFFPAQGVKGTRAPNSIVQLGGLVFYLAEDGFYVFDGTNSKPIGANKIDKTFFDDFVKSHEDRVYGAVDPLNKMIFWSYPGNGSNNGTPNKLLVYNWVTDQFTTGDIECEILFRGLGLGYTLDSLDSLGYTLDTLPFSLDSSVWIGGSLQLGAFDINHTLSYFNGTSLEATVDCEEIQPFPGQRTFVRNTRPLVDGGSPSVALGTRDLLTNSVAYGASTPMNSLGWCPQRASGRYTRGRIVIPAGTDFTHIMGIELDADAAGVR